MALLRAAEWREAVQQHKDELSNLLEEMAKDTVMLDELELQSAQIAELSEREGMNKGKQMKSHPTKLVGRLLTSLHCPNRHYGSLILQSLCSSERQQHAHHSQYTSVMIQGVAHQQKLQRARTASAVSP